jgi:hypothetical protein
MLTGGLYFNKMPFIKTGITLCIVLIALFGLNWIIATSLFGNIKDAGMYDHVTLVVGHETGTLILPANAEKFFHYTIAYAMPSILWFLPLIRMREKEF